MAALEANHASETINGMLLSVRFVQLVERELFGDRHEHLKDLVRRWFIDCPLQIEQEYLGLVGDINFSYVLML